jgi:hypothetical protein
MPWKVDDKGALVVNESGDPIFVQDGDNKEIAVNYAAIQNKWAETNRGEEKYRKDLSDLKKRLEPLKDVTDFKAYAQEHAELLEQNARLKDNTDATKFEEKLAATKASIEKAWLDKEKSLTAQLEAKQSLLAQAEDKCKELDERIQRERVRAMFNESPYIKEKCGYPPSILFELFGKYGGFDENGVFNGRLQGAEDIVRDTNGAAATFENWIFKAIESHPEGKNMLKGSDISMPGSGPSKRGPSGANPWKKESYNVSEQQRIATVNLELAKQMAAQAGVKLSI